MKRQIIKIDEDACTGCGLCIPGCPEGALQIIDGKARLVCDLFCDGLGACLGTCPVGAIEVEEREAEPYNEYLVMENIVKQGANTIAAHLKHLKDHNQDEFYRQALEVLEREGIPVPETEEFRGEKPGGCSGCPGSMTVSFRDDEDVVEDVVEEFPAGALKSHLQQWPVQLQLLNPDAPYFKNADLVIAADCVPFAFPDFHREFLKDRVLMILCPKLDQTISDYVEKLARVFENAGIRSITLVHMEVPCCFGTGRIVQAALMKSGKQIPVRDVTVSIRGEVIREENM